MNTKLILHATGNLPERTQVGDKLQITAVFTVHSIEADLIDVSRLGAIEYVPGEATISAYVNSVNIEPAA